MSNLPPLPDEFEAWIKTRAICLFLNPSSIDDQVIIYMRQAWQEAVRLERERLGVILETMSEALLDYQNFLGVPLAPSVAKAVTESVSIRARSQEGQG